MRLRNINPTGALHFPSLDLFVDKDAEFDVDDDLAESLLLQAGNFEPVDAAAHVAWEDLQAQAADDAEHGDDGPQVPTGENAGDPTGEQQWSTDQSGDAAGEQQQSGDAGDDGGEQS